MVFTHQGVSCGGKRRNLIYRPHTVREDRPDIKSLKLNYFRDKCIRWQPLHRRRLPTTLYILIILFQRWTRGWNRERTRPTLTSRSLLSLFLYHRQCVLHLCGVNPRWLLPIDRSCVGSSWSVKIFIRPSLTLTSGNSNSLPFFSVFGTGWRVDRTQIQCSGSGVFDMSVDVTFSNLLIIHQAKLRQRKSQAWRRFEYPVLISIEFDDFTSPFIPYFLFRLRKYIKHSRQCFIGYPNTSNFVKNNPLRVVFSTLFSVFGYPHETLSRVWCIM